MEPMTLQQRVRFYLEDLETPWGRAVNGAIATLIILSSAIFVIETYTIPASLEIVLDWMDWLILAAFTLEYGLRAWSAEQPRRYLFSLYGLVDLIAILPLLLGFLDLRFIRLLRWLRLLRLWRFLANQQLGGRLKTQDTLIVTRILFTLFTIIFIYSGLIFQVEHPANPDNFRNFLDAAYFAVVTMTTVGFGDVTPVSEAGRALTIMMILTGIALIPTQVGRLIGQVAKAKDPDQVSCPSCGLYGHDSDARFCKRCGNPLFKPGPNPSPDPMATEAISPASLEPGQPGVK
ncbi:Putative potassium channel protein [Halomicronema hongdechloris C2206]|uniref:Potassium channel protein n=1 Tax=Halomicronema hongdechloris C2206 TaxID=1641165 RepID=A0A1Z3HHF8_9CYAN|nr:ion transporter [Halomicronema hongdechloris]ASC69726.1 Putative potassium channel protein [Halomicronema hongdechloris C2206]